MWAPTYLSSYGKLQGLFRESCWQIHTVVTCILLRYTKITVNFCLPAERPHCMVIPLWDTYGRFWSQKLYRFDRKGLHCFVRGDRWTSKGKIASFMCRSVYSWNGQMHGQVLQAKSWVPSSLPLHRLYRAWSVACIFYTGEVGVPCGG